VNVLVRVAKRLTNWVDLPKLTIDEFRQNEFHTRDGKPDLRVSVYEIAWTGDCLQTYSEHVYPIDPTPKGQLTDVGSPACNVVVVAGSGPFSFTRGAHRELVFADVTSLDAFLTNLQAASINNALAAHAIPKKDVFAYAQGRLSAGDAEWVAAKAASAAKRWLRELK
jgi:hypothetical protein